MLQILVAVSQKFCWSQKKHEAMQKLFMKRRKKKKGEKSVEKNGQVSEIYKTMGTPMPAWKKKRWIR